MDIRKYIEERLADLNQGFDEDDSCLIEIDDDRECVIVLQEAAETVLFCVNIAEAAELDHDGLYERLLVINFLDDVTRGAALGLTPDGEVIAIRLTMNARDIGAGDIERIVAKLAELAERLDRDLKDRRHRAGESEGMESEAAFPAPSSDEPGVGPAKYA